MAVAAESGVYTGDLKKVVTSTGEEVHVRHGKGTYTYPNRFFSYSGDWVEGVKHGQGVFTLGDGSEYEGQFANGEIQGHGLRKWPNGSSYSGEFHRGEMHGGARSVAIFLHRAASSCADGIFIYANGDKYEGGFKGNKRDGEGRIECANGNSFAGHFRENRMHGDGRLIWRDVAKYSGGWANGERSGWGVEHFALSGDSFEGEFANDRRHGKGRFRHGASTVAYDGLWRDGERAVLPSELRLRALKPLPESEDDQKRCENSLL